jgi:hypothetical protein
MGLKEQRKLEKKRKARDAKRKEIRLSGLSHSYDGDKYHADHWAPYFQKIESAIYDCILESKHTITSVHIRAAIIRLIEKLRKHEIVSLEEVEPLVPFAPGNEIAFLMSRIRHSWLLIHKQLEPIGLNDLAGVHRSLVTSIDRRNNIAAGATGYVRFLLDFIPRTRSRSLGAAGPALTLLDIKAIVEDAEARRLDHDD